MSYKLVIAEKPSVAQSIAKVIGADKREDGYLVGKDYMSMVKELMQLQYDSNNLPGYLSYKELYDYMNDKING